MKISILVTAVVGVVAVAGMSQAGARATGAREDCVSYTPSTLRLTDEGQRGWLISRDDGARLMALDTREDAEVILGVFNGHREFCYVGRDNKRPNRDRFVYHYWK